MENYKKIINEIDATRKSIIDKINWYFEFFEEKKLIYNVNFDLKESNFEMIICKMNELRKTFVNHIETKIVDYCVKNKKYNFSIVVYPTDLVIQSYNLIISSKNIIYKYYNSKINDIVVLLEDASDDTLEFIYNEIEELENEKKRRK